jgi:hypothetical protein
MTTMEWNLGVLGSLVASILFAMMIAFARKSRAMIGRRTPLARRLSLGVIAACVLAADVGMWFVLDESYLLFLVPTLASLCILVWKELDQFWQIGLVGADRHVADGLGYSDSLSLCRNSLDFLGIGASKLVREAQAFEDALNRCHRDNRPMRFLLCHPDDKQLIRMAQQAGRATNEYQETVRRTLVVLARFRNQRAKNIEVRFYNGLPLFRLMFIDDAFCLASQYVFGEGDGSKLPQLHVVRAPKSESRDV